MATRRDAEQAPFSQSLRKQQLKSSKFYLFDLGVKRTLDKTIQLKPSTGQQIGPLFEHYIICEIFRLNHYLRKRFELSQLATKGGLEIDLIIERPGLKTALVEIKSSEKIEERHLKHLKSIQKEFPDFEAYCLCKENTAREQNGVRILPWKQGIAELGFVES